MLKKKPHLENHKNIAEGKLAARLEMLKSKGLSDLQIQRDVKVKHFRAAIRRARYQLADIAELEAQIAMRTEIKAKKLAAPKEDRPKPKRTAASSEKKRAKREKKLSAAAALETEE
jgi:hypothetical protein